MIYVYAITGVLIFFAFVWVFLEYLSLSEQYVDVSLQEFCCFYHVGSTLEYVLLSGKHMNAQLLGI